MKRERYKQSISVFLMLIKNEKVLLIKRINTGWMDGFYSLPAGALDQGETALQAVIREAKEEINIKVNTADVQIAHVEHNFTEGDEWLGLYFVSESWSGKPKVNEPHKHSEIKWSPIKELPENTIPYVKQAIQNFVMDIGYSNYGW